MVWCQRGSSRRWARARRKRLTGKIRPHGRRKELSKEVTETPPGVCHPVSHVGPRLPAGGGQNRLRCSGERLLVSEEEIGHSHQKMRTSRINNSIKLLDKEGARSCKRSILESLKGENRVIDITELVFMEREARAVMEREKEGRRDRERGTIGT